MSPEFIAIITVGVTLAGLVFTLNQRLERRMDRTDTKIDGLDQRLRTLEQDQAQTNERLRVLEQGQAQTNERLRVLEQGQAHLSGEMQGLREVLILRPVERE